MMKIINGIEQCTPLIFPLRDRAEWRCDPRAITFLKTWDRWNRPRFAVKRFIGDQPAIDYDKHVKYWRPYVALAHNLQELSTILTRAERYPDLMAVRGAVRVSSMNKLTIRRTYSTDYEERPDLEEAPRYWLMLDLDPEEDNTPTDFDWLSDPRRGAMWAAETYLPKSLQGVDFHYQFSSSAGIKPGLRLHFWFWLNRPYGRKELECHFPLPHHPSWAKRDLKQFDKRMRLPNQPHYTGAPIFIRRPDPLVGRRSGSVLYE